MNTPAGNRVPEPTQRITTSSGVELVVEKCFEERPRVLLRARTTKKCVLHWGIRSLNQSAWHSLPEGLWPDSTQASGPGAMQSLFKRDHGEGRISINLDPLKPGDLIEFALFFPDEGRWDNNACKNYQIPLRDNLDAGASPKEALKKLAESAEILLERVFETEGQSCLAALVLKEDGRFRVLLSSNIPAPLLLHWGIARRSPHEWLQPPAESCPPGTTMVGGNTPQTPFQFVDSVNCLELNFPELEAPLGIQFVLKRGPDGPWLKYRHGNFFLPIQAPSHGSPGLNGTALSELADRIIHAEMDSGSWTLMHRFNLCFDLLAGAQGNADLFGLLFVWLRYSAMRQLTWQRNYNTKPRELAHAQDRLSNRLADCYHSDPENRGLVRMMLATIGRGGDGQRIRDEILQIMHRHHVKEVTGHFLEEWHQKLHNNTTPDDIVICEAYLDFLRSNGNLDRFYQTLQAGGITRERLESFERPIRTNPDFPGHLKDALIHDFENFLKVLNAVHSSTDLETAINTARDRLEGETQGLLWDVWNHRNDSGNALTSLVAKITEARRRLSNLLQNGQPLRSLLYLDLALEQLVRVSVERNLHQHLGGEQLVELIGWVLENVTLSYQNEELGACLRHWNRLMRSSLEPRLSANWALHAKSVADRIGRALGDWTDRVYQLLQPKAEFLGHAFHAETWTISLFSEEVVRGSSLGFALSMLLHQVGRVLRQSAHLSAWQIVSLGRGSGQVEVVENLRDVQGRSFKHPTIVLANKVMGDEELPKEVVAVIAPDVTDLVSHVAVRARNASILFASCSDPELLKTMKSWAGKFLQIAATPAGDVVFKELIEAPPPSEPAELPRAKASVSAPTWQQFLLVADQFSPQVVGAKSCSQARLRGKLPAWVHQPASIALPFGSFEKVLERKQNTQTARRYAELVGRIQQNVDSAVLKELRGAIFELSAPEELKSCLQEALVKAALPVPNWEQSWRSIKQVWASKWNDRAVLSRRTMGLADDHLYMAVLIQPVIEADYAFVLHTVNPSTNNRDELYGEVVLGLGETLVGNFPGRALSFVWSKSSQAPRVVAFPSKSIGLYGGGLIFRSDSNGEDLAAFAGAGLYDSVLATPPRSTVLDYSEEPLVWDDGFRSGLLLALGRLGAAVEQAFEAPQDIEGVVSGSEYFVVQSRPQVGVRS